MSLPSEMIDELLSAYLDDALSGDERLRVEQLLADDPKVSAEFDELKELRRSLRVLATAPASSYRLPDGFADRVVDFAVEQAKREGLDSDHPLLRIDSTRPSVLPIRGRSFGWRVAGVVAAVAASVALAMFSMSGNAPSNDPDANQVAGVEVPPGESTVDPFVPPVIDPGIGPGSIAPDPDVPMIADVEVPKTVQPDRVRADSERPDTDVLVAPEKTKVGTPDPAMVAESGTTLPPVKSVDPAMQLRSLMVPVFEVRLTQAGHDSDAFQRAMTGASIALGDSRSLSADVVAFAKDKLDDENEGPDFGAPQIVLLECSLKKLDVLYNRLFADRDGVQSIRFGATMDSPILGMVNSVRVDPTKVQPQSMGWPLVAPNDRWAGALGRELGEIGFAELGDGGIAENLAMAAPAQDGEDATMPILILVR